VSTRTRVLATIDRGTATTAVALIGRVGGRRRLLGATAGPAGVPEEALLERIRQRVAAADPELATALGLNRPGSAADAPRLVCATAAPPEIAVIAATERVVRPLAAVAETAGWQVQPLVIDGADILAVATSLADRRVDAILAGASDPPGADERSLIGELGTLVAATTERRPDLVTVLAGGLASPGGRTEALFRPDRPGPTVLGPSPTENGGEPLRALLDGLRGGDADGRRALAAATGSLARVLRRRVEVLEIGRSGGSRHAAAWQPAADLELRTASVASAALLPRLFTDAHLDAVIGWLPLALDRLRVRDRLREMAIVPWGDAAGDGAVLRLAAVRAAAARLLELTPGFDERPAPDLMVITGGAWLAGPATAAVLAVADVSRRPGARAVGLDHARLLAPIGTIADEEERARLVADLRDDLLVPLGTVVQAAGLRPGRSAGTLTVHGVGGSADVDLAPGGVDLVDVPPGERATVEFRFREPVDLGVRLRHAALEVTGGLGGLVVDLRDIPLHLPDRLEPRRQLLAGWQAAVWPGFDR
jgi:hypothetical protein